MLRSNGGNLLGATVWWFRPWVRSSLSAGVEVPSVLVFSVASASFVLLLGDLDAVIQRR